MKTRLYEKRKTDDIVRRCRECKTTDNDVQFLVQKDTKTGKFFKHSICKICYLEITKEYRRRYYLKNRKKQIKEARKWNVENKERYNKRRRKTFLQKFYKHITRRYACAIV